MYCIYSVRNEKWKQFRQANTKKWVVVCHKTSLAKSAMGLSSVRGSSDCVYHEIAVNQKVIQPFD